MNKEVIVGHTTSSDGEYFTIMRRSERPLCALLGFIAGCLIALFAHEDLELIEILMVLLIPALLGAIFSNGQHSETISKHRIDKIVEERNRIEVHCIGALEINNQRRSRGNHERA